MVKVNFREEMKMERGVGIGCDYMQSQREYKIGYEVIEREFFN